MNTGTVTCTAVLLVLAACTDLGPAAREEERGAPAVTAEATTSTVITAHPVAHGNWITFNADGCADALGQWDCVNDQPGNAASGDPVADDGDATRLTINRRSGTPKSSFSLDAGLQPAEAVVGTIVVHARAAALGRKGRPTAIRLFLRLDPVSGPDVPCPAGASAVTGTSYVTVSCTFGGLTLTALPEIGIEETAGGGLKVTQVYASVTY